MKKKKSAFSLILGLILLLGFIPVQGIHAEAGEPVLVDQILISMEEPRAGGTFPTEVTSTEPEKYSVELDGWSVLTQNGYLDNRKIFIQGSMYKVYVKITMAEGYKRDTNTKVYLNDMQLQLNNIDQDSFYYNGTFQIPSPTGEPVELFDSVHAHIKEPRPGEAPDLQPTVYEENKCGISLVDWGETEVFEPNKTYTVTIEVYPKPGYQISPLAYVSINGQLVDLSFNTDDPLKITMNYSFTTPSEQTIYDVGISDVQEPKAGKYTSFQCTCDSDLYQLQSVAWAREQYDMIQEFFIPGNNYHRIIILKAKEGYTFAPASNVRFTVNGETKSFAIGNENTELTYWENFFIEEPTAGTWMSNSSGWWYQYPDGSYETDGLLKIGNGVFYFKKNGYIHTGWLQKDGEWYYFDQNGYMLEDWQMIDGDWYYFSSPDGVMLKDTEVEGYYLNELGVWVPDKWVYSESAGKYWYSYSYGGYPYDTIKTIGNHEYCFDKDGYMVTGWHYDDYMEGWFYFDNSGAKVKDGWYWIDGECYYFYPDHGTMAADETIEGYYVDASGKWVRDRWIHNQWGWWYSYAKGGYPKSTFEKINGKTYYFDEYGYIVTGFIYMNQEWYCFDDSGAMYANGWQWIDGDCYYFYKDGVMARNKTIDGSYVSWSGAWVP